MSAWGHSRQFDDVRATSAYLIPDSGGIADLSALRIRANIFGKRGGSSGPQVGTQCKGKSSDYGSALTKQSSRSKLRRQRNLVHRSTKFIIVTTAPEDAKIQQAARPLEGKVRGEGRNLLIQVWGWGRVQEEISRFPEAIRAFHPDAQPFTDQIRDEMRETQRLAAEGNASSATGIAVKQTLAQMMAQRPPLSTDTSAASDALDRELPDHIDTYRDLMREGQPRTALQLLTKLKDNAAITGGDAILPLLLHLYNRTKNSLNFDDLNSLKLHRSHVNV